jgi:hypothetical protein
MRNFSSGQMASFTAAASTAILLMAQGTDGEYRGSVSSIPAADVAAAFRDVFGAALALTGCGAPCTILMEEKPLAASGWRWRSRMLSFRATLSIRSYLSVAI